MTELSPQSNVTKVSLVPAICMGMHIRRASRIMTQIYDAALRPVGLVLNQFTLLVAIHLVESTPVTRLAQELFTDQTTLTRNLKVLEERGLVVIEPGADRRVRLVSLTPEGRALLAQALPLWEQAQVEVQARFRQQRWQKLLSLLSDTQALVDTPHRNVIHPQFGNFILLRTILIAAQVSTYTYPIDYNPCLECKLCVADCRVGAIGADGHFDFSACYTHNYREFMGGFTDWSETIADSKNARDYRSSVDDSESASMWHDKAH